MNDLPQASEYFMPVLFADDTNFFATGYDLNDIISQINKEIHDVYAWVNKLSFNTEKTNLMLLTTKCLLRIIKGIFIAWNKIMEMTETKFLGVIIDYKLNWSLHIMYISKKVAKGVSIILKARNYLIRRPCWHCAVHLFIRTWIISYMFGVKLIMFISMISLSCKIRLYE